MKTILVLTDFSATAQAALQYAVGLTQQLRAKLMILHAIPRHSIWLGGLDGNLIEEAQQKLGKLKEKLILQGMPGQAVNTEVINKFPLDAVANDYARAVHADLIVMGTQGVSGTKKEPLGSFAIEVMENSTVPVIGTNH